MKKSLLWLGIFCMIFVLGTISANATLIIYEDFNYTFGALTAVSVGFGDWSTHSGTVGQWSTMNTPGDIGNSLSYPGLAPSVGSRIYKDRTFTEDVNRKIPTVTPPAVLYYSALVKVTETPTHPHYFMHFGEGAGFTLFPARLFVQNTAGNVNFGISFKGGTGIYPATGNFALNQTHLLVVKLEMLAGVASDSVSLWINPTSIGGGPEPPADIIVDNGALANVTVANGIRYIGLRAATAGQHGNIEIDEIRVSRTWFDATVPVELSEFKTE